MGLKWSVIANHVSSAKHKAGKERLEKNEGREAGIASALRSHNATVHLTGESRPEQQQVFRVKVMTCFLRAAVPVNKVDIFRDLLEEDCLLSY